MRTVFLIQMELKKYGDCFLNWKETWVTTLPALTFSLSHRFSLRTAQHLVQGVPKLLKMGAPVLLRTGTQKTTPNSEQFLTMKSASFAKISLINIVDIPLGSLQLNFRAFCTNKSFTASIFPKSVHFWGAIRDKSWKTPMTAKWPASSFQTVFNPVFFNCTSHWVYYCSKT